MIEQQIREIITRLDKIESSLVIGTGKIESEYSFLFGARNVEVGVGVKDIVKQILAHLELKPIKPDPVACELVSSEEDDSEED